MKQPENNTKRQLGLAAKWWSIMCILMMDTVMAVFFCFFFALPKSLRKGIKTRVKFPIFTM